MKYIRWWFLKAKGRVRAKILSWKAFKSLPETSSEYYSFPFHFCVVLELFKKQMFVLVFLWFSPFIFLKLIMMFSEVLWLQYNIVNFLLFYMLFIWVLMNLCQLKCSTKDTLKKLCMFNDLQLFFMFDVLTYVLRSKYFSYCNFYIWKIISILIERIFNHDKKEKGSSAYYQKKMCFVLLPFVGWKE